MKNYAYKNTSVNWVKSQGAIVKMLIQRNIYETRFTSLRDRFVLEFRAEDASVSRPISVRIVVPLKADATEKDLNRLHRVLFYHLKAKFTAIDSGVTEFMEEFMPHLVVTDSQGKSGTMGEMLLPQYRDGIESGKQEGIKLLE